MVLVTGGTGFVGREVVQELLRLRQPVRVLIRRPEKARFLPFAENPGIEFVRGDVLQPETLPAALEGVQTVIHLVGFIAETSRVTYVRGHIEATQNLLAAARLAGVTRWVQMSAAGTREHARSRYHQTKWEAEQLVRASGLDWTIFRPSLIYGYDRHDRLLNLLKSALSFPANLLLLHSLPLIDGGRPRIQPVSVREVAHCFAAAPMHREAIGRTLDLVGPVALTWREMVLKILAALGKPGAYEELPIGLALRLLLVIALLLLLVRTVFPHHAAWINRSGLDTGAFGLAAWVLVRHWRTTLIFNLPGEWLIRVSEPLNLVAPRALRPSEVLKMSVEDNVGDPAPAAAMFDYTPEPLETGIARLMVQKTPRNAKSAS